LEGPSFKLAPFEEQKPLQTVRTHLLFVGFIVIVLERKQLRRMRGGVKCGTLHATISLLDGSTKELKYENSSI
jgi:hypothetical protein